MKLDDMLPGKYEGEEKVEKTLKTLTPNILLDFQYC